MNPVQLDVTREELYRRLLGQPEDEDVTSADDDEYEHFKAENTAPMAVRSNANANANWLACLKLKKHQFKTSTSHGHVSDATYKCANGGGDEHEQSFRGGVAADSVAVGDDDEEVELERNSVAFKTFVVEKLRDLLVMHSSFAYSD